MEASIKALYHFKAALREQHLLLGTPRHGKEDTLNYSLSYPPAVASSSFGLDDCMVPKKVYVFQIDAQMADKFYSTLTNITDFFQTHFTPVKNLKTILTFHGANYSVNVVYCYHNFIKNRFIETFGPYIIHKKEV